MKREAERNTPRELDAVADLRGLDGGRRGSVRGTRHPAGSHLPSDLPAPARTKPPWPPLRIGSFSDFVKMRCQARATISLRSAPEQVARGAGRRAASSGARCEYVSSASVTVA